jgi:hypothetical protein
MNPLKALQRGEINHLRVILEANGNLRCADQRTGQNVLFALESRPVRFLKSNPGKNKPHK